jgi:RHH-type proline utilization regulon transcriptional repressor/proline dehydrogenase/delta 1-pyrroline-5-carboxylate dehydrogenase
VVHCFAYFLGVDAHSQSDDIAERAVGLVRRLLSATETSHTARERRARRRIARLVDDPSALWTTATLSDAVMRVARPSAATRLLRQVAAKSPVTTRSGLGLRDSLGLKLLGAISPISSPLATRVVHLVVRDAAKGIILPREVGALREHMRTRGDSMRFNINVLGEAVLGDREAQARLDAVCEMMRRPEVDYISVKISAITSQIVTVDHAGSLARVCERLRTVYRTALTHGTFVNLDMEEYRDLALTIDAFTTVLAEPEFASLDAGIVLQAYLPESHFAARRLIDFAAQRHHQHQSTVKIRVVKGANLAMERTEAELHGWCAAPYATKAEVDASWLRLIDLLLHRDTPTGVRVGIASHNLFGLAWALTIADVRGTRDRLDVEMLEGMANAEARAVASIAGSVLLYAPVVAHDDFPSAVAYLVRRLDENTSADNYLRASFHITPESAEFAAQEQRFRAALAARNTVSTASRRRAAVDAALAFARGEFVNEPDGDPTDVALVRLAHAAPHVPAPDVASLDQIEQTLGELRRGAAAWSARSPRERTEILGRAATLMAAERATTIAIMGREAGKTFDEANPEVSEAIDFARFYAIQGEQLGDLTQPLGVVCVVPPWNFPYAIPAGGVFAALAAGNTVVLKPAPQTTGVAWHLADQLWRAGVPRDALAYLRTHDDHTGQHLVAHPQVDAVILTGSFDTAQLFVGWKPELHLLAETSGKNSMIVAASADIDVAVKDLVHSAFSHAGQKCSAASLAIVDEGVLHSSRFLEQLRDAVCTLRVGHGGDPATVMGSLIDPPGDALRRALSTLDHGESWLVEPQPLNGDINTATLWSPGVRLGVTPGSWCQRTEWFGPMLGIIAARDLDHAIEIQNSTEFALTAGLHALDEEECERWLARVNAGNLYVNRATTGAVVARQPFGGWRRSCIGATAKAGGVHYLHNLVRWPKATTTNGVAAQVSAWWREHGAQVRPSSTLNAERNFTRFAPYERVVVVHDSHDTVTPALCAVFRETMNIDVTLATPDATFELNLDTKVRWCSSASAPTARFIAAGAAYDTRPITSCVAAEAPRWLREQSVSVAHHRYGNVGMGPQPQVLPRVASPVTSDT